MNKTDELHGRVVLVPGASRPIGRAIAHSFARRGATLVLPIYPDWPESNREMEQQFNRADYDYFCLPCDLTSWEQTGDLLSEVKHRYGVLHYLINNIDRGGMPVVHGSYEKAVNKQQWQLEFDTTLKAKHHLYQHSFDLLSASEDGAVVNVSSIAALVGRSGPASLLYSDGYSAANRGIASFTRQWAKELAPAVRVNEVMLGLFEGRHGPGTRGWELMDTTQHHELLKRTLAGRTGTPDEAAEFIYYLAVSASYLTGAVIPFDGGFLLGANRVGEMPKGILD